MELKRLADLHFAKMEIETDRNMVCKRTLEDFTSNFKSLYGISFEMVYELFHGDQEVATAQITEAIEKWSFGRWYGEFEWDGKTLKIIPYIGDRFITISKNEWDAWRVVVDYTRRPTATHKYRHLCDAHTIIWSLSSDQWDYRTEIEDTVEYPSEKTWAIIERASYSYARDWAIEFCKKNNLLFEDGLMKKSDYNSENEPIITIIF